MSARALLGSSMVPFVLASLLSAAGCGGDDTTHGSGGNGASGGSGGAGPGGGGSGGAPAEDRHVVVLFTSDEHSHLFAFSPEVDDYPLATSKGTGKLLGGVPRRATVIARERKAAKAAKKD